MNCDFYTATSLLLALWYPLLRALGLLRPVPFLLAPAYSLPPLPSLSVQNIALVSAYLMLLTKYFKSSSSAQMLNDSFRIAKLTNLCVLYFVSYTALGLYGALLAVHTFVVRQTITTCLLRCNEKSFCEVVERGKGRRTKELETAPDFSNKEMYFVELYTNWAETCLNTKPIWHELAAKFSTSRLKFVEINLQKCKDLAARYSINLSSVSRQLPTLLMVEDGCEVARFPPLDEEGRVPKVLLYDKKELIRYFWLEERYLMTRES